MSRFLNKTKAYLELARIELAGFSFVAVMGGLTVKGMTLSLREVIGLFVANVLLVILGFVHNDYRDAAIDAQSPELGERPILKGTITLKEAKLLSGLVFVLNLVVTGMLLPNPFALTLLAIAQVLAMLYNVYSKSIPGADLLYAASAAFLCFFGAAAAADLSVSNLALPGLAWTLVGIMFFEHLFFNIASGQVKDINLDQKVGVRTLAVIMSRERDGGLRTTPAFRGLLFFLKTCSVFLVFVPLLFLDLAFHPFQAGLLIFMAVSTLVLTAQLLQADPSDRKNVLDLTRKQETVCKAMTPIMLFTVIGLPWVLILTMIPVIWFGFFNYLLHRELFSNPRTF